MNEVELAAVWDFVNESDMNEIVGTANDAANFVKSTFDASVTVFKAEMSTSPITPTSPPPPKSKRERQKVYEKKYREKKGVRRVEAAKAFVAGLELLNLLLEDRIQRTRRVSTTMRLLPLGKDDKKFPEYERDLQNTNQEAKTQFGLNQAAATYIELWTSTWTKQNRER